MNCNSLIPSPLIGEAGTEETFQSIPNWKDTMDAMNIKTNVFITILFFKINKEGPVAPNRVYMVVKWDSRIGSSFYFCIFLKEKEGLLTAIYFMT